MVRLLVGTRKGAFVLTSDANRIYASQSSGWFGQKIQHPAPGVFGEAEAFRKALP